MNGRDENGLSADPVHVDAGPCLQVVEVDVAKLGDEVDHIVLGAHLERGGLNGTPTTSVCVCVCGAF